MDLQMSDLEEVMSPMLQDDDDDDNTVFVQMDPLKDDIKVEDDHDSGDVEIEGAEEVDMHRDRPKKFFCRCGLCGLQFEEINALSAHISKHEKNSQLMRNALPIPQGTSDVSSPQAKNKSVKQTASKTIEPSAKKSISEHEKSSELLRNTLTMPHGTSDVSRPQARNTVKQTASKTIEPPAKKSKIDSLVQRTQQNKAKLIAKIAAEWKFCPFCNMKCSSGAELASHRQTHITTDGNDFECNECGHVCIHKSQINCDFCEEKFLTRRDLLVHVRSHVRNIGNECEECHIYFPTRRLWDEHVRLHEMYQCHMCTEKFTLNSKLFAHLKTHDAFYAYACETCKERFKEKSELREHKKIHYNESRRTMMDELEPWRVCEFCQRRFTKYHNYKSHIPIHAPFFCHICNAFYNDYDELQQHKSTEQHLYECDACNEKFEQKNLLTLHVGDPKNRTRCAALIAAKKNVASSNAQ